MKFKLPHFLIIEQSVPRMKKLFLLATLWFSTNYTAHASVEVSVSHACFKGDKENFIEFNLYIVGQSVKWIQVDTTDSQAHVEVNVQFKQGGKIVQFDKYAIHSPKSFEPINFVDVKRYGLKNGLYDIEVSFKDLNKEKNEATYKSNIIVDYDDKNLRQSDIQLLSYYETDSLNKRVGSKNGVFMEALPFGFYDRNLTNLMFYNEIYNTDQNIPEDFLVSYTVIKAFGSPNEKPALITHRRKKTAAVVTNLLSLDIAQLESGNYRFLVTVRNKNNDLLSEKETFFQRSNPAFSKLDTLSATSIQDQFVGQMSEKDLRYSIRAIMMLLPDDEVPIATDILRKQDTSAQRLLLFKYWAKKSAAMPEQAHDEYMMTAKTVDRTYGNGMGFGFDTDRGRIFMKYGRPTDVTTVENETGAPPYEIWVFDKIEKNQQTNVKFIFYNPNLIANGYRLLHSTCRGEIQNPRWISDLYKNAPSNQQNGNYIDGTGNVSRDFNRRAEQLFKDN
jgi:GWxTD domain-containing protein